MIKNLLILFILALSFAGCNATTEAVVADFCATVTDSSGGLYSGKASFVVTIYDEARARGHKLSYANVDVDHGLYCRHLQICENGDSHCIRPTMSDDDIQNADWVSVPTQTEGYKILEAVAVLPNDSGRVLFAETVSLGDWINTETISNNEDEFTTSTWKITKMGVHGTFSPVPKTQADSKLVIGVAAK